jgi:hypothetical protein
LSIESKGSDVGRAAKFVAAVAVGFIVVTCLQQAARGDEGDDTVVIHGVTPDGYPFTYGGNREQAQYLTEIGDAMVVER